MHKLTKLFYTNAQEKIKKKNNPKTYPATLILVQHSWKTFWWRRKWQSTPVFLPGESHGWRSLVGYSPWDHKELDTTEQLPFPFWRKKQLKERRDICRPMVNSC